MTKFCHYDGFVTVICLNFVTEIVFITKFASFLSQNCDGIVTKIHHKIVTN